MVTSLFLALCLVASPGLATAEEIDTTLRQLGGADLMIMNDPSSAHPVRVLLATRISAPVDKVRQVLSQPASYRKAIPAFRRVDPLSQRARESGGADWEIGWELDVPLWNLKGKLWLRPSDSGVDIELSEGDLSPGLFHLRARPDAGPTSTIFAIEGFANLRDANLAARELTKRSALAEPAMTVAASYVLLKALAHLAETGSSDRPKASIAAPELNALSGAALGKLSLKLANPRAVLAAIHSRADGRLAYVAVSARAPGTPGKAIARSMRPETFRAFPGWKKVALVDEGPDDCRDPSALCWGVGTNLPLFALDGTWKVWPRPWRARMVEGDRKGAVMALDFVASQPAGEVSVVLAQHPRLDRAGMVPRKLIDAEPYLEHGLALALTLVNTISLAPALGGS